MKKRTKVGARIEVGLEVLTVLEDGALDLATLLERVRPSLDGHSGKRDALIDILASLERSGLVEAIEGDASSSLSERVYELTELGRAEAREPWPI